MSIVVTGGAGFIGSCMVRELNNDGYHDIIIVDNIAETEKWKNLSNKTYLEYIHKSEFLERLPQLDGITHIIHLGACSSTTEKNFDYLYKNNFEYTKALWNYCTEKQISFIYASSAATYGDGSNGFDDMQDIKKLIPLNGYGYSKQLFDLWVEKQNKYPKQYVGFKFFNVYGPNEYCKGSMASVILHAYKQIKSNGMVNLFNSYNPNYRDGEQLRDFVYVKDICKVIKYMMQNPNINGLFNLGTGQARSFNDLVNATFAALEMEPKINYIDMPEHLREKYQYYTQASMKKLRNAGYTEAFYSLEDGVKDYVINYLKNACTIY